MATHQPPGDVQITHPYTYIRVGNTQLAIRPESDGALDPCVAIEADQLVPGGKQTSVWLTTEQARDLETALAAEHATVTLTDHVGDALTITLTSDEIAITVTRSAENDIQEPASVHMSLPTTCRTEVRAALIAAADQSQQEAGISE
ncbi:hypothetical protein [Streptomyces sp. NBC_00046]|uniref:hypothetical protein n=1 Tax=unclassified Streptomyces TaxID=2593676 RepID=UPI003246C746